MYGWYATKYLMHQKQYCGTSGYTRKGEQLVREDDLFLTRLVITNDDVKRYSDKIPELKNLSQGERIAFVRQFRELTQDNVTEKLGLNGVNKRRAMTRYEKEKRSPKKNRLLELANIINVNPKIIKEYNFQNQEDLIYVLLWMEEKYSRMSLDFNILEYLQHQNKLLLNFMDEWNDMRRKK